MLLGVSLLLVQTWIPGGAVQQPWLYGLGACVPYALASAMTVWVPWDAGPEPPRPYQFLDLTGAARSEEGGGGTPEG